MLIIRHLWVRLASVETLLGLALVLAPGPAMAQLSKPQQVCVKALNNGLAKVARAQGKVNLQCIKDGRKGNLAKLGPSETLEGCLTDDVRGKVARRVQATLEKEATRQVQARTSVEATTRQLRVAAAR